MSVTVSKLRKFTNLTPQQFKNKMKKGGYIVSDTDCKGLRLQRIFANCLGHMFAQYSGKGIGDGCISLDTGSFYVSQPVFVGEKIHEMTVEQYGKLISMSGRKVVKFNSENFSDTYTKNHW